MINQNVISQLTQAIPNFRRLVSETDLFDVNDLKNLRSHVDQTERETDDPTIRKAAQSAQKSIQRQIETADKRDRVQGADTDGQAPKKSATKEFAKAGAGAAKDTTKNFTRNAIMRSSIGPAIAQFSAVKDSIGQGIKKFKDIKGSADTSPTEQTGQTSSKEEQSNDTLSEINDKLGRLVSLFERQIDQDKQQFKDMKFSRAGRRENKYERRLGGVNAITGGAPFVGGAAERNGMLEEGFGWQDMAQMAGVDASVNTAFEGAKKGVGRLRNRGQVPTYRPTTQSATGGAPRTAPNATRSGRFARMSKYAPSLRKLGKFGKFGLPLAALTGGVTSAMDASDEGRSTGQITGAGIGGGVGGVVGGAAVGAAAGSVIPGVGTVVGGILGALAGTEVGSAIGQSIASEFAGGRSGKNAKKLADNINEADKNKAFEMAEKASVVGQGWLGNDEINDWNTVRRLNSQQINNLIRQGDWSESTLRRLRQYRDGQTFGETIPVDIPASKISSKVASADVIDTSWFNDTEIKDKKALQQLKPGQLSKLLKVEQFTPEDAQYIRQLINKKTGNTPSLTDRLTGKGDLFSQLETEGIVDDTVGRNVIRDEDQLKDLSIGQLQRLLDDGYFDQPSRKKLKNLIVKKKKKDGFKNPMEALRDIGAVSVTKRGGPGARGQEAVEGSASGIDWSIVDQMPRSAMKQLYDHSALGKEAKEQLAHTYKEKFNEPIKRSIQEGSRAKGQSERNMKGEEAVNRTKQKADVGGPMGNSVINNYYYNNNSRTSIEGSGSGETSADQSAGSKATERDST